MKNRYGVTPWGSWFIDVLDSYQMGSRLDRGRSYANSGRVLSLALDQGRALAKVKGSYRPSYRVEISFPPLKSAEQVYKLIEEDPPLLARIASGELPESFLKKLKNKGINLIPRRWKEMKRFCSCPDDGDPCKHMAALYYIIAGEIDADPHVLFRLRGMDLEARFGKEAVHIVSPPFTVTYTDDLSPPQQMTEFPDLEEIPLCTDLITGLLPPAPSFCSRDFAVLMAEFYHRCARSRIWESAETEINAEMEHNFSRSVWKVFCPEPGPSASIFLDAEDINGNVRRFTPYDAFEYFVYFSSEDGSLSYTFLFYLFKFLNLVCSSGAFIPYVFQDDGKLRVIWRPFETLPAVRTMLDALGERECGMLEAALPVKKGRKSGSEEKIIKRASGRSVVDLLASAFLNEWVYRKVLTFGSNFSPRGKTGEYPDILDLFFYNKDSDVSSPSRRSLPQIIDRWLSVLHINFAAYSYCLTVKEARRALAGDDVFFSLSMEVTGEDEEGPKKTHLFKVKEIDILRAPIALSNYLPEIRTLTRRSTVRLSETRLVAFLDSAASLLTRLGMIVNLPKTLHRELKPRLLVRGKSAASLAKFLDLNTLQDFEWQVALGGEVLSIREFEKLVNEKRALVRFREGFVKIDPEEFSRLLKKAKNSPPDFNDFLKAHFSGDTVLAFDAREIMDNLFRERNLPVPDDLKAELRPYQKRGYDWIYSLLLSGFGCILADDMGLGKTIQSIAVLLKLRDDGLLAGSPRGNPSGNFNGNPDGEFDGDSGGDSAGYSDFHGCLVVAPAALLVNWENELARFAPSLAVSRYHGLNRILNRQYDVFLTTYQTAVRDAAKLKEINFSLLLVDEAHLMKNAETRVSKTVKQLRSRYRLALSGTPVENRLEDLRSLFDFILPGYLGNAAAFREQYRIPIEVMRNKEQAEALKKITAPFLLRRLKTDKKIIEDLPEKIVANEYALLEKDQAALYEGVVSESIERSAKADPKERSALILTLLTSLKQICDHPRVFDKESPAVSELSGKAQLLVTLLEGILANREKTLVFSQYVETLDCLDRIIKKEMNEAPLMYHGGLTQNARSQVIERFRSDPASGILLVSLKAGGLGLNLTAASRVIHYDLWYNPAVENQATDRAHRLGQDKPVFVYKLIVSGSIEEKILALQERKAELAAGILSEDRGIEVKFGNDDLAALFEPLPG